jgi:8-oxo-dGTP pyrophosphatase MutT (NUDIX family)
MPIPDHVAALRAAVGHDLLLLVGVSAVVRNDRGQVLLELRSDVRRWSLVSGILEPGEQPAAGLLREIREETGIEAEVTDLASVWLMPDVTYPNGDVAQYLDLCFLARHVSGVARVGDDESLDVGWFDLDALPEGLTDSARTRLERALAFDGRTLFER